MARNSVVDKQFENWREKMLSERTPVVSECIRDETNPCKRIEEGTQLCLAYINPSVRWKLGTCPLATHVVTRINAEQGKTRVGQQKQKRKKR